MLLVTRNEETLLISPSICHICEQSPAFGSIVVDTLRNYSTGINGIGRKYVCESCVGELAAVLGLSSGVGERVAKAENEAYARAFETLRHEMRAQTERLVALVNEPLANLDPIYGRDEVEVEEFTAEEIIEAAEEQLGEVEVTIGAGQDSFPVEVEPHVQRSVGM